GWAGDACPRGAALARGLAYGRRGAGGAHGLCHRAPDRWRCDRSDLTQPVAVRDSHGGPAQHHHHGGADTGTPGDGSCRHMMTRFASSVSLLGMGALLLWMTLRGYRNGELRAGSRLLGP